MSYMRKNKTWYLEETTIEMLNEVKINNNFVSMNQVFDYLLEIENKYKGLKTDPAEKRLGVIDKNLEMILEIVSFSADRHDHVPVTSYRDGYSASFNKAKELLDKRIEKETKAKGENNFFN